MAIIRIKKTKDYTVMSNHHLRNKELSLKAKGLLSVILSLPDDWNYTVAGLAKICKEGADSIRGALKELEQRGYIVRSRVRNAKGQLKEAEYIVYENPMTARSENGENADEHTDAEPVFDLPMGGEPTRKKSALEKSAQLNTYVSNTKKSSKDLSSTYPIQSMGRIAKKELIGFDEIEAYRNLVKENIEYDILRLKLKNNISMLDEIVDIITETVCTSKEYLTVASDTYPVEIVKSKLLKLTSEHIEYVIDCMKSNTADIRNIKKYLLAALFNAPSTIDAYYAARVNHDMYGGKQ